MSIDFWTPENPLFPIAMFIAMFVSFFLSWKAKETLGWFGYVFDEEE